jgi:hypothetical protein
MVLLLVIFQLKHFLADYPLQGHYMLGKFKEGWGYIVPLAAHCLVHAVFTFGIVSWWLISLDDVENRFSLALSLATIDFLSHFIMDRVKAAPKMLGMFKPLSAIDYKFYYSTKDRPDSGAALLDNKMFWICLGLDQMVHHLTNYYIIYRLVSAMVLS